MRLPRVRPRAIFESLSNKRNNMAKSMSPPGDGRVHVSNTCEDTTGTWGTDTMIFRDDELSYALGKQGGTRKKLEKSSGAIVQYVGQTALFSGTRTERKRAKEYIKWLFDQLEGPLYVEDWDKRDDCTVVEAAQRPQEMPHTQPTRASAQKSHTRNCDCFERRSENRLGIGGARSDRGQKEPVYKRAMQGIATALRQNLAV